MHELIPTVVIILPLIAIQVPNFFAQCVGGVMSTVGQNITVYLQVEEICSIMEIRTSWPIKWKIPEKKLDNTLNKKIAYIIIHICVSECIKLFLK